MECFVTHDNYLWNGFEEDGACGTHGRGEKSVHDFSRKAQRRVTTRKTEV
jgi:hypothetical protein